MDAFSIPDLISGQAAAKGRYLEFLRRDSLSMGVYTLPQGGVDPQKPHAEDEVYYVLGGTASISVGDEQRAVAPGDLIYVDKEVEHRFHTITADLSLLVFFAPAEGTMPPAERSQPPATS